MYYRPGSEKPRSLPGKALRDLLNKYQLQGNEGADLAAYYLGYSRQAIQAMMSRTIRTNDYELLQYKLMEYRVEAMVADTFHGPIREDGKRHRNDNWRAQLTRKQELNRAMTREKRRLDPQYGRKPKPAGRSTLNPVKNLPE